MSRPDDYQAEATRLVEWAFANAAYYKKNAPALTDDIQGFEDIAALLDTFRAGLILVPPHPAMQAELIRWIRVEDEMPDAEETVLLALDNDSPWPGYFDGLDWRGADGIYIPAESVTHWASMPAGPAQVPPIEARHDAEESAQ